MKPFRITATLLAAAAFIATPGAFADPMTAPPGERAGQGGHGPRHGGNKRLFPFLHGIDLSEAQQDRLFAILHAQAPQQRAQLQAERNPGQ